MRPADKYERAVAVHEAAHVAVCYWNRFKFLETRIRRKGDVTKGEGTVKIPPFPQGWRTDPEAQLALKVHFYKCLMIFSAGYLAEWMFSGEKDFWKINRDFMKQKEKTDFQVMREVAATIPKKEFENILNMAHDLIADPERWGIILDTAQALLKYRVFKYFPYCLGNDCSDPIEPEHDAAPLIKFIVDELHGRS